MKSHSPKTIVYNLTASRFEWEIAPGKMVAAWGFNNSVPGPEIRAKVGDTLIIRVDNNLPEPTLIHWHGLRLPSEMDGTDAVQKPILPGDTFEYKFTVQDAGTFWYHSHANETEQMERGLYGALIVEDDSDPEADCERVLMIDDMKLNEDLSFTKPSGYFSRVKERHDGRLGDTLLINGNEKPLINVHAGQQERWRFINASSARYFQLYLGGKPFQIIGTDGGLLENSITKSSALITPGERLDIIVGPFEEGEKIQMESLAYNRTTFLRAKKEQFATILVGKKQPSIASIRQELRKIKPLAPRDAAVNKKVKLSVTMNLKNGMDFKVNNGIHVNDSPARMNELQVWEVSNVSLMDHPFHLHGFFFQVLEENGEAPNFISWKDTYNLTPRSKIKIAFLPDRPGMWMYHCHILEHHEAGMMAHFEVVDANSDLTQHVHHHEHHHVHHH